MDNIIKIKNLSFGYNEKLIFNNLNLNINQGEWVSVVGPNSSGKSTLVKLLTGLLPNNDNIYISDLKLNKENINTIRKKIGVIFSNVNNQFVGETVRDDIAFILENLQYNSKEINKRIEKISKELGIEDLLNLEPNYLNANDKQKVVLASVLIHNPSILILDEVFSMVDKYERSNIFKLLKKIHKEKKITIINVTNDLEETYFSDRVVILKNGSILLEGLTNEILKKEEILRKNGFKIPFMVDLSLKLKLYGLIDDIVLDMDEMVMKIWK
jgi:energy-coupling factor transport system ATP-binding protein